MEALGKEFTDGVTRLVLRELSELELKEGLDVALAVNKEELIPEDEDFVNPLLPVTGEVYKLGLLPLSLCEKVPNMGRLFCFWLERAFA